MKQITAYYECLTSEPFTLKPMIKLLKTPGFDPNKHYLIKKFSTKYVESDLLSCIFLNAFRPDGRAATIVIKNDKPEMNLEAKAQAIFNYYIKDKRVKLEEAPAVTTRIGTIFSRNNQEIIINYFKYGKLSPDYLSILIGSKCSSISMANIYMTYITEGVRIFLSNMSYPDFDKALETQQANTFNDRVQKILFSTMQAKAGNHLTDAKKFNIYSDVFQELQSTSKLAKDIIANNLQLDKEIFKLQKDSLNDRAINKIPEISKLQEKSTLVAKLLEDYSAYLKALCQEALPLIEEDINMLTILITVLGQESSHHDKLKNAVIPTEKGNFNLFFYLNGICKYMTKGSEGNKLKQEFPLLDLPKEIISHILSYVEDYDIAYSEPNGESINIDVLEPSSNTISSEYSVQNNDSLFTQYLGALYKCCDCNIL
ncbi:MAG: hypothetical protein K0Q51_413 [Rickettsiaceae bacterium]|jgi:hypothetical protein|nr:hypothetical protein [Rickettsiaceae bacterium]